MGPEREAQGEQGPEQAQQLVGAFHVGHYLRVQRVQGEEQRSQGGHRVGAGGAGGQGRAQQLPQRLVEHHAQQAEEQGVLQVQEVGKPGIGAQVPEAVAGRVAHHFLGGILLYRGQQLGFQGKEGGRERPVAAAGQGVDILLVVAVEGIVGEDGRYPGHPALHQGVVADDGHVIHGPLVGNGVGVHQHGQGKEHGLHQSVPAQPAGQPPRGSRRRGNRRGNSGGHRQKAGKTAKRQK
jgi:hypothetical protein